MTHIRKAALLCDVCGETIEIDPDIEHPFASSFVHRESAWRDWIQAEGNHLCGKCAAPYLAKKREAEAELKRLAGIKTVEFDV